MGLEGRHVAVVGGGIGGAATALMAARAGARVTLLEQRGGPCPADTGLVLQPNGLAVLYGLDLDERLMRRGVRLSSLRVADPRGRTIIDVPVPRFAEGLDHALVVHRTELISALFDLVAAEPAIECHFGTTVLEATSSGAVTYRDPSGSHGFDANVVVGADGVHSAIRRHSGLHARVGLGRRYVRGLGPEVPLDGRMTEYWTGLGIFGVAPLRHGCYFYASADARPLAQALARGDVGAFRDTWRRELPLAGDVLAEADRLDDTFVVRVDCEPWTSGRIVLVGDAAHAMAPNLGQGAGSALVDAAVLVWELAQPGETAAALARYEARRRPAVRAVQKIAGWLGRLSELGPAGLRAVRDASLHVLAPLLVGDVGMRLVEQQDPLWLRIAAANPSQSLRL
jgi:2-polyprenyl-6-methoxyphenol hydroxylase-like FAD-dependent oxidoreductase